jgi:hypothetical protein
MLNVRLLLFYTIFGSTSLFLFWIHLHGVCMQYVCSMLNVDALQAIYNSFTIYYIVHVLITRITSLVKQL